MCLSLPFITHSHQLPALSHLLSVSMGLLFQTFHINEIGQYVASVSGFFPSASCFCGSSPLQHGSALCPFSGCVWALTHPACGHCTRFSPLLTHPQLGSLSAAPSPLGKCRNSCHCEQTGVDHPTDSSPTEHFRGLWRSQGCCPRSPEPAAFSPARGWLPSGRRPSPSRGP